MTYFLCYSDASNLGVFSNPSHVRHVLWGATTKEDAIKMAKREWLKIKAEKSRVSHPTIEDFVASLDEETGEVK